MTDRAIEIRWRDLDAYGHVHQRPLAGGALLGLDRGIWDYVSLSAEGREVERKVFAPTSAPRTLHERLRRIAFFFRRLVG